MTRPAPYRLGLSRINYQVLEFIAGQAQRLPDAYVEEGLTMALWGARALLNNELDEKPSTGLLIAKDGVVHEAYDLGAILRPPAVPPRTVPALPPGIIDPFATDERIPLQVDPDILDNAEAICDELQTPLGGFISSSVDIRGIVFDAMRNERRALVETAVEAEFIDLASTLQATPEEY